MPWSNFQVGALLAPTLLVGSVFLWRTQGKLRAEQAKLARLTQMLKEQETPEDRGEVTSTSSGGHDTRVGEFLRATFDSIDEGITIFDSDLKLVMWNRRFQELSTGVDKKFLKHGTCLIDLYREIAGRGVLGDGDPEKIAQAHINAITNGPLIKREFLRGENGRITRINRFSLNNGGICATFRDVTDEVEMEQQLQQAQKMESIGRLTGGIAHDINNTLTMVIGNAEFMLREKCTSQQVTFLKGIIEAAQRSAQITSSMLSFAREKPQSPDKIDVPTLLDELKSFLGPTLGEKIAISTDISDDIWSLEADHAQLESALVNLAINARDAMPSGGHIEFRASNIVLDANTAEDFELAPGQFVQLEIIDNGPGIPAANQPFVFEPYFTTKSEGEGTGLGLAMVFGFAKQSRGTVRLHSDSNGSTFQIFLPRAQS